jgi:hypothetical protein
VGFSDLGVHRIINGSVFGAAGELWYGLPATGSEDVDK